MNQSNSNRQKCLFVTGGFIFGASVVAAVVVSYNLLRQENSTSSSSTLRGSSGIPNNDSSSNTLLGNTPDYQKNSNITYPFVEVSQDISHNATSNGAQLMSTMEAVASSAVLTSFSKPSATDKIAMYPTYSPTVEDVFPTFMPTEFNDSLPNVLPVKRFNGNEFRLKLYWEEGYYWQESTNEKWWCMSCEDDGNCVLGAKMKLRDCKLKSDLDTTFIATSYSDDGHQLRVTNTNLCLQKMGARRAIKLKKCMKPRSKHLRLQLFKGYKPNEKFDLRPSSYSDRCLSNHHHPKAREVLYAETCEKAHRSETGYWIKY